MAATTSSRAKQAGPVLGATPNFQRSISPSQRLCSSSSLIFAASSSSFSAQSPSFFHRSSSPTRVNLLTNANAPPSSSRSVRFSIDRPISPNRSVSVSSPAVVKKHQSGIGLPGQKRMCMCSPTTHPGSFRCSLHKNAAGGVSHAPPYQSNRLNARRSAMTNSLVRIGTVEGELVKRALTALIRPSSHQQRRRTAFQAKPSRLSIMSTAEDLQKETLEN